MIKLRDAESGCNRMNNDLEEIKLECDHTGSAKRIRVGKRRAKAIFNSMPKWKKQLIGYNTRGKVRRNSK